MSSYWQDGDISNLIGKVLVSAIGEPGDEEMVFVTSCGEKWTFYHRQDCCENVEIEEVIGDLQCLVDSPILQAEVVSDDDFEDNVVDRGDGSHTWTFYKFATIFGYVTVRWLGTSSGYYSEKVSLRMEKVN